MKKFLLLVIAMFCAVFLTSQSVLANVVTYTNNNGDAEAALAANNTLINSVPTSGFGDGVRAINDYTLTVNSSSAGDVAAAIAAIDQTTNDIVKVEISGTVGAEDYEALAALTKVAEVDYSGINSGYDNMAIPSSATKVKLPGTEEFKNSDTMLTLNNDNAVSNLPKIMSVLANAGMRPTAVKESINWNDVFSCNENGNNTLSIKQGNNAVTIEEMTTIVMAVKEAGFNPAKYNIKIKDANNQEAQITEQGILNINGASTTAMQELVNAFDNVGITANRYNLQSIQYNQDGHQATASCDPYNNNKLDLTANDITGMSEMLKAFTGAGITPGSYVIKVDNSRITLTTDYQNKNKLTVNTASSVAELKDIITTMSGSGISIDEYEVTLASGTTFKDGVLTIADGDVNNVDAIIDALEAVSSSITVVKLPSSSTEIPESVKNLNALHFAYYTNGDDAYAYVNGYMNEALSYNNNEIKNKNNIHLSGSAGNSESLKLENKALVDLSEMTNLPNSHVLVPGCTTLVLPKGNGLPSDVNSLKEHPHEQVPKVIIAPDSTGDVLTIQCTQAGQMNANYKNETFVKNAETVVFQEGDSHNVNDEAVVTDADKWNKSLATGQEVLYVPSGLQTDENVTAASAGDVKTAIEGNRTTVLTGLVVKGEMNTADYATASAQTTLTDVDYSRVTSGLTGMTLPASAKNVKFPNGVEYHDGVLTVPAGTDVADLTTIKSILDGANLPLTGVVLPGGSYENGELKLTDNSKLTDNISYLEALGLGKPIAVEFSNGTSLSGSGKLTVNDADFNDDGTTLGAIRQALDENHYSIENVVLSDMSEWKKGGSLITKYEENSAERTTIINKLNTAGFTVDENKISKYTFAGKYVTVEGEGDDQIVTFHLPAGLDAPKIFEGGDNNPNKISDQELTYLRSAKHFKMVGDFSDGQKGRGILDKLGEKLGANTIEKLDLSDAILPSGFTLTNSYKSSNLKELWLPTDPSYTTVAPSFANNMTSLETVHIPSNVKEIGNGAFQGDTHLGTVDWGNNPQVEVIGESAFERTFSELGQDENGKDIVVPLVIPNSVKTISSKAFKGAVCISSVTINKGSELEYIGSEAFVMDSGSDFALKNVYVYEERMIECDKDAWDKYQTDGQTVMATVKTRLHYPPSLYDYYVGNWKSQLHGGRIEGHEALLDLRNAVDHASFTNDNGQTQNITDYKYVGWQKFISTGIPVTADTEWRTYSDIVALKVPAFAVNDVDKVADVYIVCGYEDGNAVLKQMVPGDIIPARTGIVIKHYVTDQTYGGLLMFPRPTEDEWHAFSHNNLSDDPREPKPADPYRFVSSDDLRGYEGVSIWNTDQWKDSPYVGIKTHDYYPSNENEAHYPNYLEAIYTQGNARAIYNAENGNYQDYYTLVMARKSGQQVTYRNFFFGNGVKLKNAMIAGKIAKGDDFNYDTDGQREWGFFRCITDMYDINSKAFLHFPASVFTQNHGGSAPAVNGSTSSQINAKEMGMILIGYENIEEYGIATIINEVKPEKPKDDSYYTLQGVKVTAPTKRGIYIHNGKKILVK